MSDLISRKEVIKHIKAMHRNVGKDVIYMEKDNLLALITVIELLPPAERKRGYWVYDENGYDYGLPAWKCNHCGCINANIPPRIMTKESKPDYSPVNPNAFSGSNFCSNCGADMREK